MGGRYIPALGEGVRNAPLSVQRQQALLDQAKRDGLRVDPDVKVYVERPGSLPTFGGSMPDSENDGELPAADSQSDFYPNFPGSQNAPSPLAAAAPGGQPGSLDALLASRRKSVADMYDEAAKQLQASYRGPNTSELLLALGAGLLRPTASGSFGEAIGQGLEGVLPLLQQRHTSQDALNKELAGVRMNKAKDIGDLEEKYLLAQLKSQQPPKIRSGIDPSTGVVKNLDTGEIVAPFPKVTRDAAGMAAYGALNSGDQYLDVAHNVIRTKP